MNLIKQIYASFDNFDNEMCRGYNGYNPVWRPNWNEEIEAELNLIKQHSPISIPDDYCEVFRVFGGGGIDDRRSNQVMPTITFWKWDDIKEFDATVNFFEDCPNALPFGDDIGDMVYFLMESSTESGVYMADKSMVWDEEFRIKIANSLTELFVNAEVQRRFRNLYRFGEDKGGDGR